MPKYPLEVINKKFDADYFTKIRYGEWFNYVSLEQARKAHARNLENCRKAIEEHVNNKNIKILAVHGSGRSLTLSCAHEKSNSQMLLQKGLEAAGDAEIKEVKLRDYNIEPCNGCYSTASALCNFACTCFPLDPMQELYPKVLWCDILLCSTGVNQSAMSTRLKAFCDRLISLDGGYYVSPEQFAWKDAVYREKMIATSIEQPVSYDQRMQNRVAAFFISTKDDNDAYGKDDHGEPYRKYSRMVAESLYRGFHDYGFYFGSPWYAVFAANHLEEMSYDKQRLNEDTGAHAEAKKVVQSAIKKAQEIKKNPPKAREHPPNRT